MSNANIRAALQQYGSVGTEAAVLAASPHQVIDMLLGGALDRLAAAKGFMLRRNVADKGRKIGQAIGIVAGLHRSLNMERGGEVAANLDALYDYIERRLQEANRRNDAAMLDEVAGLLGKIKAGWDGIPADVAAAHRWD